MVSQLSFASVLLNNPSVSKRLKRNAEWRSIIYKTLSLKKQFFFNVGYLRQPLKHCAATCQKRCFSFFPYFCTTNILSSQSGKEWSKWVHLFTMGDRAKCPVILLEVTTGNKLLTGKMNPTPAWKKFASIQFLALSGTTLETLLNKLYWQPISEKPLNHLLKQCNEGFGVKKKRYIAFWKTKKWLIIAIILKRPRGLLLFAILVGKLKV